MLDWTKPLQTRSGLKATIHYEYYNGVKQMVVASLSRGPTTPGGKDVEVIKTYDKRWGKVDGNPSMTPNDPWDLMEVPPPDKTGYVVVWHHNHDAEELTATSYSIKQNLFQTEALGQIKVVIDGRTGKIKALTAVD